MQIWLVEWMHYKSIVLGLTNHEMAGEVFGFIYGSYQKPLSVMIFCLYQLSVNLLVQEQLCREVKEVMNKCSGVLQAQALEQMTYMDRVIKGKYCM